MEKSSIPQFLTDDPKFGRWQLPKWPDHLVIVRHAESERNVWKEIATTKGDFIYRGKVRDMDVGLTPTGERQAVAQTKGKRDVSVSIAYSSLRSHVL